MASSMSYANFAIATPVHTAFTYIVPDGIELSPGMRAIVPFRRNETVGICLELIEGEPSLELKTKLKKINGVCENETAVSQDLIKLIRWMSVYYCAPIGEVMRLALPSRLMKIKTPKTTRPMNPLEHHAIHEKEIRLMEGQQRVLNAVIDSLAASRSAVFLLHGITGSGKTEVYLRFFEELKKRGKRGLLLVPEIGLTPQLTGRASSRFGDRVAIYHSGLTDAQRFAQWLKIKNGNADVVIGTRSAIFAPIPKLGAIVVDEEHDSSYKQDDGVQYHGRDVAVMRAHIEGVPIVLGSATPSLESLENARIGKYKLFSLTTRPGNAVLPSVEIVDMRPAKKPPVGGANTEGIKKRRELSALSPQLYDAIAETLSRGEQALLYIGRRGFAASLQCGACGFVPSCPNCDITLTPHGQEKTVNRAASPTRQMLLCHYCDYKIAVSDRCSGCGRGVLMPIGHGTERLEGELKDFFPAARVARFDSDTTTSQLKRHRILSDMRMGKIDILVGTQMVTKGHDFPAITLVGVVAADALLSLPDFRSAERTFQLLTQVSGRAGRGSRPGRVIIQTRQPGHASFNAARDHNLQTFANQELDCRRELAYPPFSRLINIRVSSNKKDAAEKAAGAAAALIKKTLKKLADGEKFAILGPAPAPIEKLRNKFRWQILIKTPSAGHLITLLAHARPLLHDSAVPGVRLSIDVDPINLL